MTNRQNIENNLTTEISSSERVYALEDLPEDVREKLLLMQKTDGDFLYVSSGETQRRVILLIPVIFASIGLAGIIADDVNEKILDLKRIIAFSVDALVLLLWFVYLAGKIFIILGSPLKNRVYITPTQVIETLDKTVRYRQLRDVSEINIDRFWSDIGRRNTLNIKFNDGDDYEYSIGGSSNSGQRSAMENWQKQAAAWKNKAVGKFQNNETDYFAANDVISNLAESNTPILRRDYRTQKENLLLLLTIALIALSGILIFFIIK